MIRKIHPVLTLGLYVFVLSATAHAALIYSDDFNADTSANYNKFITAGATGPSGDATFAYNYGAAPASGGLSIPVAPHTTDGSKLGLRLRTDNLQSSVGTVVGATEIVTKTLSLPPKYQISVDVWSNYIGSGTSIGTSGTNGSTGVTVGIGTAGTSIQYINTNDGLLFEGFGDNGGGANQAYRVYTNNTHPNPTTKNYWSAGTGTNSATNTDPYYTSLLTSVPAPAGQSSFAATQGGSTAAGTLGFGWHVWTITNDGTNVVWAIDNKTITTVPVADFTSAGGQVALGNNDTNLSGSSVANNQLFNAEIFDNLTIIEIPEPASAMLFALGLVGCCLAASRQRS